MLNLEQAIADWRKQMLAAGIKTPVPLEELESHLREDIEQQMQLGSDVEKAFESAVRKMGQVYPLRAEFAKIGDEGKSAKWEQWFAVIILAGVVIPLGIYGLLKNDMSLGWRLLGFADVVVIVLAVFGCRYINKSFPVIPNTRVRMAIGLSFGIFGMIGMVVFANFILPNYEFTEGQLVVVVLWAMTLMAAFCAVLAGLEEAARRQTTTSDS